MPRIVGRKVGVGEPQLLDAAPEIDVELLDHGRERGDVAHALVVRVRFEQRRFFCCQRGHMFVRVTRT